MKMTPTTLDRKARKKWLKCPALAIVLALLLVLSSLPVYAGEQQTEQTETPTVTQDAGSESAQSATSSEQYEPLADELEPVQPIDPQEPEVAANDNWENIEPYIGILLNGSYVGFKNKSSGKYLTIPNGTTSVGTNVCQQSHKDIANAQEFYLSYTYTPNKRLAYFTINAVELSGSTASTRVKSAAINTNAGVANVSLQYFMPIEMTDRWQIEHYEDNYYIIHMASKPYESGSRYVLSAQPGEGGTGGSDIYAQGNVFVTTLTANSTPDDSVLWQICADGLPMDIDANDITENKSYTLDENGQITFYYIPYRFNESLTWQSSNIYTVSHPSNQGKATAIAPGRSTISLRIFKDGQPETVSSQVYVKLPDGVYYLNNVGNGMRWDLEQNKVSENNPVQIYDAGANDTEDLNLLYKFHYLGNGLYSIRSMMKNAMGVTWIDGDKVVIANIGTTHIGVGSHENSQWYLDKNSHGYVIYAKTGRAKTITVPTGAASSDNLIVSPYSNTNTNQAWIIRSSAITVNKISLSGVYEDITSQNTYEIMPHYISHLDEYNGNVELDWTILSGSDKVCFGDSFGTINVIGAGDFSIKVFITDNLPFQTNSETFDFHAYPTPSEGDWFIENVSYGQVISTSGQLESGSLITLASFSDHVFMEWELEYVNYDYFRIKSKATQNYLSSQQSSVLYPMIQSNILNDHSLWKIERTDENRYRITNKAYESGNWCLSAASNGLYLYSYTNDSIYNDEWYLNISGADLTILAIAEPDRTRGEYAIEAALNATANNVECNIIIPDEISKKAVLVGISTSSIFVSRSHGSNDTIQVIQINGPEPFLYAYDIYDFSNSTPMVDFSECELIAFIGCKTAKHEESIARAAVEAGAAASIGFVMNIGTDNADKWMVQFLKYYLDGFTIDESIENALKSENGGSVTSVDVLYPDDNQ